MPEVKLKAPVSATYVEDFPTEGCGAPGTFSYYKNMQGHVAGLLYICPCGCGASGSLAFRASGDVGKEYPKWIWNGNKAQPTLSPSIHHVGHWHGWLQGGIFKDA